MSTGSKIAIGIGTFAIIVIAASFATGAYYLISFRRGRSFFDEGVAAMNRREYGPAIKGFKNAIQNRLTEPYKALAFEDLAFCENEKNQAREAIRDYSEALRLDSKAVFAWEARGQLYLDQGNKDKAFDDFSKAILLDSNMDRALFNRGLINLDRKHWPQAVADFSEAIRTSPAWSTAYYNRAIAYAHLGDLDRALASVEATIQMNPHYAKAYAERGYIYSRKHDFERACADFDEALRLQPEKPETYRDRGFAFIQAKQWSKALSDFNKTLELKPNESVALEGRSYTYEQMGDLDRAVADLTKVVDQTKSVSDYERRAYLYSRKRDYPRALADFREALRSAPDDEHALNNLAWFLATCPEDSVRNAREAVADATKACALSHWMNGKWLDTLAAAWAEAGSFDLAVSYEEEAFWCPDITEAIRGDMEKRRGLFQMHKPFRKPTEP